MARQVELSRHNINLSRQVWGELKLRSFQEGLSASELAAYVVEKFFKEGPGSVTIPRYQPRDPDEDRLGRTVFFPQHTWDMVKLLASQNSTSASGLIDHLLKRYLGLLPEPEGGTYPYPTSQQVVRVGEERVYLGENPVRIDFKTGKPIQD